MSVYLGDERVVFEESGDEKKDILGNISSRINKGGEPPTMEQEKRMRREIANSNERRRMQSINNGFQSLRGLLPHHEGEKLSKAAILQQTAEYIYSLEQEKTRLLSQNCQLKRLVNQHEGGELPPKKRKTELILPTTDSSDEGLGSMSPEPVSLITVTNVAASADNPSHDLKRQLERERNTRLMLEEQVRQLEEQLYAQQQQNAAAQIYQLEDGDDLSLQLVAADSVPPVGHTQTVVCSPPVSRSPSPEPPKLVVVPEPLVPAQQQLPPPPQRLPSVLEAAIKAEPKVEVERLPSPNHTVQHEESSPSRLYVSNTSRQNLETIVEAIRHLEGDHMFGDEPQQPPAPQEVPLALTTRAAPAAEATAAAAAAVCIKQEMHAFLDFNVATAAAATVAAADRQQQQSRPGVIVAKQAS
ncbi:unnamed protein product [Brassicogethes aeneus]|uniref:BHLH domain-containing protein n=1 Tax=Brassicogethes aeneus TaxID=1431903 RepID=A0A9P0FK26_BRAAE|nr:unnamed protein product [Brassicogethes aeneus]